MESWYYVDAHRQQQGPLASEALVQRFHQGELRLDTLVWKDGMADWQPLRDFTSELALDQPPQENLMGVATGAAAASADIRLDPSVGYTPYAPPVAAIEADAGVVGGGEVVLAGFWKRAAASLLDGLVVGIGSWIIAMVMVMVVFGLSAAGGFASGDPSAMGTSMIAVQIGSNLFGILVAAAYYAGFHASSSQATLGKMTVGIKVVRSNGHRITLGRGIGRYFATWLSFLTIGIGFLMAAFTQRKQGLHDMVCDTLVVDKWAYTAHPEWQNPRLGTVTVVILSIYAVLMLGVIALFAVIIGLAVSNA
jgi:uncharacterized RDD family membrane protein YckC